MTEHTPSLQDYPGYYPPGTKRFWTRTKVGTAAGVTGLLLGLGLGAPADGSDPAAAEPAEPALTQTDLDTAVADATSELNDRLDEQSRQAAIVERQAARQAKRQQKQAVRTAVAEVRRQERARAAKAVAKARQQAEAAAAAAAQEQAQSAAPAPQPLASNGGSTDPQFSYCYEANDAGYGPYYQGEDPEYDWYDDADGDGIVCET